MELTSNLDDDDEEEEDEPKMRRARWRQKRGRGSAVEEGVAAAASVTMGATPERVDDVDEDDDSRTPACAESSGAASSAIR